MSETIFCLVIGLWFLWSFKRDQIELDNIDKHINDGFLKLYAKWLFGTFPEFDYFFNEIKFRNPTN